MKVNSAEKLSNKDDTLAKGKPAISQSSQRLKSCWHTWCRVQIKSARRIRNHELKNLHLHYHPWNRNHY
ncbi:hypothetical protein CR513_41929, partial [Mucuna pruriens]